MEMSGVEIGLSAALAVLGATSTALLKMISSKLEHIEKQSESAKQELADFKLKVANDYASRDDLKDLERVITSSFSQLSDKMDGMRNEIGNMSNTFRDKLERKQDR
jgi:hypothetical protein